MLESEKHRIKLHRHIIMAWLWLCCVTAGDRNKSGSSRTNSVSLRVSIVVWQACFKFKIHYYPSHPQYFSLQCNCFLTQPFICLFSFHFTFARSSKMSITKTKWPQLAVCYRGTSQCCTRPPVLACNTLTWRPIRLTGTWSTSSCSMQCLASPTRLRLLPLKTLCWASQREVESWHMPSTTLM